MPPPLTATATTHILPPHFHRALLMNNDTYDACPFQEIKQSYWVLWVKTHETNCRLMTTEKNGSQMSSSQMPHFSLKSLKGWPPSTKCRRESILGQLKCEEVNCKKSIPKVRRSQLQEVNSREAIVKWTQLLVHTPAYGGWSILLSTKIKNSYQIGGQFNSSEERKKYQNQNQGSIQKRQ